MAHIFDRRYMVRRAYQGDMIPSIDRPVFDPYTPGFHNESELGVGVVFQGIARFYPINILSYHEIVNDIFASKKICVTYSPLTNTAVSFRDREYGPSEYLYMNNLVLQDRNNMHNANLIVQMLRLDLKSGRVLDDLVVPTLITTLSDWKKHHPQTSILSRKTGFNFNYDVNPFHAYSHNDEIKFPVRMSLKDTRFHPKQPTLIVIGRGSAIHVYDCWSKLSQAAHNIWARRDGAMYPIILQGYWFALSGFFVKNLA
jgi:hypothetical protein